MVRSLRFVSSVSMVAAIVVAAEARAAEQQNTASTAILFQGFHWNSWRGGNGYDVLGGRAADLRDLGVTHVWFPPPSDAASSEGYLPRRLNVLDSAYGSEARLRAAISALSAQGIASVADVVVNHRVGTTSWGDFTEPTWGCEAVTSNDEWSGRCGAADTGDPYGAARDLDHTSFTVQNGIRTWLTSRLRDVGFTGLRYDYSRGYGATYARNYHDAFVPTFCVGEIWTDLNYDQVDAHRQLLMNWIDGTGGQCATFDFTTKGLLNRALSTGEYWRLRDSAGRPAGAIGWWAQKQVTFVDNHDTGPSESCSVGQNHWPVPCGEVMQGYAYILSHPGIPTIYSPHVYDWNLRAPIRALVQARRSMGVSSTSAVSIQRAEQGLYAAIVTGTSGQLAVKIGPNAWSPTGSWTLAASGSNYAVWTSGAPPTCNVTVTFTIANASTTFGQNLYVAGNQAALGSWAPASAFALTIQGSGANVPWSGTVTLPANTNVQYKYIKQNPSTGQVVWESNQSTASGNREFNTGATCNATLVRNDGNFRF
ncbi:alpha-amylase [Myxococcota bacterium]|nr:alpha-amylase [Myxococcota bacterium]